MNIRLIDHRDAIYIQELASSEHIAKATSIPHPYPQDGGVKFIEFAFSRYGSGKSIPFAIEVDKQFIGLVTINGLDTTPSIDYWIGYPYWGKGFATQAVKEALKYGEKFLNISFFQSEALENNLASHKVLTKNGFIKVQEEDYSGPKESHIGQKLFIFQTKKNC